MINNHQIHSSTHHFHALVAVFTNKQTKHSHYIELLSLLISKTFLPLPKFTTILHIDFID